MFEPEYTISSATRGVWRLIEIQVPTCKECNGPRAKSCRLCLCQVRPSCSAREGLRELSQLATGLERAQHAHTPEAWQKSLAKISITLARAYLSSSQHGGHDEHNALSLLRLRSTAKDRCNVSCAYDGKNGKHLLEETRENLQHMVMPLRVSSIYLRLKALIKFTLMHVLPAPIDTTK